MLLCNINSPKLKHKTNFILFSLAIYGLHPKEKLIAINPYYLIYPIQYHANEVDKKGEF